MAEFFSQTSWLGIEFCDLGVKLDPLNLADRQFYAAFYEKLLRTYPCYRDYSIDWRLQKYKDAEFLSRFIAKDSNLLSYGCGVGYLESCLMGFLETSFFVTDFSPVILHYRPDLNSKFLDIRKLDQFSFSTILLSQVSYALSDIDLIFLFKKLHNLLEVDGLLIVSFYEQASQLNTAIRRVFSSFSSLKSSLRCKKMKSNSIGPGPVATEQGWGFHRSKKEMIDISTEAEFKIYHFCRFGSQAFLLLSKVDMGDSEEM